MIKKSTTVCQKDDFEIDSNLTYIKRCCDFNLETSSCDPDNYIKVKYKNGKAKRNDKFTSGAIPFYHQLRLSKTISENLELELNFKLRTMFGDTDSTWTTLYPKVTVELPSDAGSISTGIRFNWNNAQYDGLSSVSIPLTWSYKFKKKF